MKQIIIGIVGQFASGKGTVSKYLAKKYHAKVLKFSDVLTDILNRVGQDVIRANQSKVAESLRKDFGEDILSQVLMKNIVTSSKKIVVIDGFRKMGELNFFKGMDNFVLINVKADLKTRYRRIMNRGEKADEKKKSLKSFKNDHRLAADTDIVKVGKQANYTVNNFETKEKLYKQIDKIIKKINEKK